ncbi:hypothetical protein BTVI_80197 [Pitangus sulphuratus]|nr:hypothetical protein BTVI_80197 [Pitangus sulphuratus]
MGDHRGAETHLQPMGELMLEQVDAEGGCDPGEVQDGAGSCQRPAACGEGSPRWSRFFPEGNERATVVSTWGPARVNPLHKVTVQDGESEQIRVLQNCKNS